MNIKIDARMLFIRILNNFHCQPFSNRQFGISLLQYKVILLNRTPNITFVPPAIVPFIITNPKRFVATGKLERIPLNDIENIKLDYLKHDLSAWCQIVDEIVKARTNGKEIPSSLDLDNIEELLHLNSGRQRFKYLKFLFKKEKKKLADVEKKLKKRNEPPNTIANIQDAGHIQYGIGKNTLLIRIWRQAMNKLYYKKLVNSVLFGPKIVFDLSYDEFMWNKERRDCAAQLRLVYSVNRLNPVPYDLYFCNATENSKCVKFLREELPNIDESLISLTEQSYLDIFPKNNLVYLSPHASETLKTYDHNAVYIIGGFVDTVKREHISLYKSQNENIKSYALPLNEHVLWGVGSKSLSINQVFSIMMTLRDTGEWKEAFKHIPTRKIRKLEPNTDNIDLVSDKMFLLKN